MTLKSRKKWRHVDKQALIDGHTPRCSDVVIRDRIVWMRFVPPTAQGGRWTESGFGEVDMINVGAFAGAGKRTDVYHGHFTKAALRPAASLGGWRNKPHPNNPIPNHHIGTSRCMAVDQRLFVNVAPLFATFQCHRLLS